MALKCVLFSDKSLGRKQPLIDRLKQRGVNVLWRENVENSVVSAEVMRLGVQAVITNQSRVPDGPSAGLALCRMLRSHGYTGSLVLFSASLNTAIQAQALGDGVDLATGQLDELEIFLEKLSSVPGQLEELEANVKRPDSAPRPSASCLGLQANMERPSSAPRPSLGCLAHLIQEASSGGLLDVLRDIAPKVDLIINSANNHLLTPGCSGIAGALLAAGGHQVQQESNAARAAAGGSVQVGQAVLTGGGNLPCFIAHAVALAYGSKGRVPATPESVRSSFAAALSLAMERGASTVVVKLMCARPGYSTIPAADAPAVMLNAMMDGLKDVKTSSQDMNVFIFLPASSALFPPLALRSEGIHPKVLFSDKALGNKSAFFKRLQSQGLDVIYRENVANKSVADEVLSSDISCVVTNHSRNADGKDAGLELCKLLISKQFQGRIVFYTKHTDAELLVQAWLCGAHLVTSELSEVEGFLHHLSGPGDH